MTASQSSTTDLPFDRSAVFDPSGDFDAFLKLLPAKWVVYLLADEADRPIQLLCVKNLRASLKRRLTGDESVEPTRRINYRELVRRIHWKTVDSAFEADWLYYEAARQIFPHTYQGMVGFGPAWFVHVDPESPFPRYTKTINLCSRDGLLIGPLPDKHAAARLIETLEDLFDLCRFYNILIESPAGKACAYKEMGKCPAPCDGSISMEQYRRLIEWSAQSAIHPDKIRRHAADRIRQAAGELRFEAAAKAKAYADQLAVLGKGAFRHARLIEDFRFISVQRGPRAGTAKVFAITPGHIETIACIINISTSSPELQREIAGRCAKAAVSLDLAGAERVGIAAQHLFAPESAAGGGAFIHANQIDQKTLTQALTHLRKQRPALESDDEGLVKELQAM